MVIWNQHYFLVAPYDDSTIHSPITWKCHDSLSKYWIDRMPLSAFHWIITWAVHHALLEDKPDEMRTGLCIFFSKSMNSAQCPIEAPIRWNTTAGLLHSINQSIYNLPCWRPELRNAGLPPLIIQSIHEYSTLPYQTYQRNTLMKCGLTCTFIPINP